MSLGAHIKAARKAKKVNQGEVAKAVGVTISAVSQWETGETKPEMENIPPLAEYLGLDAADLMAALAGKRGDPGDPLAKPRTSVISRDPVPVNGAKVSALLDGRIELQLDWDQTVRADVAFDREAGWQLVDALIAKLGPRPPSS